MFERKGACWQGRCQINKRNRPEGQMEHRHERDVLKCKKWPVTLDPETVCGSVQTKVTASLTISSCAFDPSG